MFEVPRLSWTEFPFKHEFYYLFQWFPTAAPLLFVVQEYPAFDYSDFSLYFIIFIAFIFQLFPICFHNFFPRKGSRSFLSKCKKSCENNLEDLTFDNGKDFSYSALQENIIVLATSVQFSSVAQSCPTLCNPMNCSTPGLPVHYQLPEFTQTHVHWVGDAIQPSHPLSSPSPPAPNPLQHQSLFQWVNSSHEVGKVLEFQFQQHSFQRTPRADLL